jgi:glycosyltransferase involved in cell wall biosynthesis
MHIIGSLEIGGAETMLCKLVEAADRQRIEHIVVSLLPLDVLQHRLAATGAEVLSLNMPRNRLILSDICRLAKLIKKRKPDLVHTWMYISDVIGGLAARLTGKIPVIFSIRHGRFIVASTRTILLARVVALLAHLIPARIITCSSAAGDIHRQIGYPSKLIRVIPNGFVINDHTSLQGKLRSHLGVNPAAMLVGIIGRYAPGKDYQNFITAAAIVKKQIPAAEFIMCGKGVEKSNAALFAAIGAAGLCDCVHLLGRQMNTAWILADLSLLVSSSASEAFANVIGEAMASGIPCVTTDVGDSAHIVGNTGIIVPPHDPEALAQGMLQMLRKPSAELKQMGMLARERMMQMFSLPAVARRYENIYFEVVNDR